MTPEPEQPDDLVSAAHGGGPDILNTMSGHAGVVVQVGVVSGDVHLHAALRTAPEVPRQLPAAPSVFAGRTAELAALDRALIARSLDGRAGSVPSPDTDAPAAGATVMISAIGGAGGIGKTWLALTWAHGNLHRFPDGQLFVDLHGFSPTGRPTEPAVAVRNFLDALGVDPGGLPPDLDAQAALYRSLVAERRMLIVLDNAATADQVVSLLPGGPHCTVLVTGRTTLPALIDRHGAHHLQLDVLARAEAHALFIRRLGTRGIDADPDATDELIELCGYHPLALTITARRAATNPAVPLAELATELRDLGLDMLDHDSDPTVSLPSVLSWSLRHLTDEQRRVFALLGAAPGPGIDLPGVVALASLPETQARRILHTLEEHSLLNRQALGRYTMHDLIRTYATTVARDYVPEPELRAALDRVVDFYLHTADAAVKLLNPHRALTRLDLPVSGGRTYPLPDAATALAWLDAHHLHLLAAQHTAASYRRYQTVWHLAWALTTFHWRRGHRHDELAVWQTAADAASHLPDPAIQIRTHRLLGRAHSEVGQHEQAVRHLDRALALAGHHHDLEQEAETHRTLTWIWERQGDDRRALIHARRALDLYRALDQPVWEADALNLVGWYAAPLRVRVR